LKIYAFSTPTHRVLLEEWFLPTLPSEMSLVLEEHAQDCPTGVYGEAGWLACMEKKIALVLRAARECRGELFVHSDVDVQFFRPFADELAALMQGYDLRFQLDAPDGTVCAGFFVCRASSLTERFFEAVLRELSTGKGDHDQQIINRMLRRRRQAPSGRLRRALLRPWRAPSETAADDWTQLRWGRLPGSFFGGGTRTGRLWKPGQAIDIPEDPAMHHANWIEGVESKLAQLECVREAVRRG